MSNNISVEYYSFSDETISFINRAIDIYRALDKKELKKTVRKLGNFGENIEKTYNKIDKKVLSIFMSGFSKDSGIDKVLEECDDITYKNVLEWSELKEKEITPMDEKDYKKYYDDYFKLFVNNLMEELSSFYIIKRITPSIFMWSLHSSHDINSNVIEDIVEKYSRDKYAPLTMETSLFRTIESVCKMNGDMEPIDFSRKESNANDAPSFGSLIGGLFGGGSPFMFPVPNFDLSDSDSFEDKEDADTEKRVETKENKEEINIGPDTWNYIETLRKKYIGQEEFAEELFYNIVNNIELSKQDGVSDGERSIIFVDGPSGTGKTAITTDIAKKLGVPYVCTSVTNFSSTGYVGGDLTDILKDLAEKANFDRKKAERGIIIIDEFDKVATNSDNDLKMKKAVQDQLLGLLGGETYNVSMGHSLFTGDKKLEFDTSKLTIICLGAITNLRDEKTSNKQPIGFSTEISTGENEYNITPDDLISMGLQKELVGRLNTFLHTNDYDVATLERILRESDISPMTSFTNWVKRYGKSVEVDDEVYPLMAAKAYDFNTGARSLQTIMDSIRTRYIRQVLRGEEPNIHLTSDDVRAAYAKTVNRSKRG